jgi:radical SAM protein with 4Fe4S-binding SPASM domain
MIHIKLVEDRAKHHLLLPAQNTKRTPDCDCACPIENANFIKLDNPTIYSLEITGLCNNNCSGCSNVFLEDSLSRTLKPYNANTLSIAQWKQILNKISPYATRIKITGGEPTLSPDFYQIVNEIERLNIFYTIFTNGIWINPDEFINFISDKKYCAGLLVSLHGSTQKSHEAFSGKKKSFKQTVRNIKKATKAGISVYASTVLTSYNLSQIEDIVELSFEIGASSVVFNRYIGTPISHIEISKTDLFFATQKIEQLKNEGASVHFGTCIPSCFADTSSSGCMAGTAYCTIDPVGNLRPCNHVPQIAGNLLTNSLETLWNSQIMEEWRKMVPNECVTCDAFSLCHGGCRAEAQLRDLSQDPLIEGQKHIQNFNYNSSREIQLYSQAKLKFNYAGKRQKNGNMLFDKNEIVLLSEKDYFIYKSIEEKGVSLQEVEKHYGIELLSTIGKLYIHDVVSFDF